VLLLFATEVEILNEQQTPDRDPLLREAALAYRARSKCYEEKGQAALAAADEKRAARLEAAAKKLAEKAARKEAATAEGNGKKETDAAKNQDEGGGGEKSEAKKKDPQQGKAAQIRLVNEWKEPVTVVVSGTAYWLRAGQTRMVPKPPGPFTYEVQVRQHWSRGTLEAGKTFTIRIRDR
jgi:hypothetical protein